MNAVSGPADQTLPGLTAELRITLQRLGFVLQDALEPWWIIGSAAVALFGGAPITVRDIDVVLSEAELGRVCARLGLAHDTKAPHPLFRSTAFATWDENPLPVEFMAGFHLRQGDSWIAVAPKTRRAITLTDCALHVPERHELQDILMRFGRPKDLERSRLLAQIEP